MGYSVTEETLAPPMESPATVEAIRGELRAYDGGVGKEGVRDGGDRAQEIGRLEREIAKMRTQEEAIQATLADLNEKISAARRTESHLMQSEHPDAMGDAEVPGGVVSKLEEEVRGLQDYAIITRGQRREKERELARLWKEASPDGGGKIETRIAQLEEKIGSLHGYLEHTPNETPVLGEITDLELKVADLTLGLEYFVTLDGSLPENVLRQALQLEKPVVFGYDLAYFFANPDAAVEYWRLVRQDPNFGKIGKSGVISVLLPYAYAEGIPGIVERGLVGIDSQNIPQLLAKLNDFVNKHMHIQDEEEQVDLRPEDFGLVVPSDRLLDPALTSEFVEGKTGYRLTRVIARKEVAVALDEVQSIVALVFDLPFEDDVVGISTLEELFEIPVGAGTPFVQVTPQTVTERAGEELRKFQDLYTKF